MAQNGIEGLVPMLSKIVAILFIESSWIKPLL